MGRSNSNPEQQEAQKNASGDELSDNDNKPAVLSDTEIVYNYGESEVGSSRAQFNKDLECMKLMQEEQNNEQEKTPFIKLIDEAKQRNPFAKIEDKQRSKSAIGIKESTKTTKLLDDAELGIGYSSF